MPEVPTPEGDHASRRAAAASIAEEIGCTAQTPDAWVRKAGTDAGRRSGVSTKTAERLKALERENRELRQANEILRKASACLADAVGRAHARQLDQADRDTWRREMEQDAGDLRD